VVLGVRALALTALEDLDVRVGLVGERGLEAVAVVIGEGQLSAGMRTLAPDEQPGPRRPRAEVNVLGDLADLPVLTLAAVGRERRNPRVLGDVEDRGTNWSVSS
jgi:hypothetical protein